MNKTSILFLFFALVAVSFTVGYKLGDSHGFSEGFDNGYSYDCRPKIDSMMKRSDSVYKVMEFLSRDCQVTAIENHRMRYDKWADSVKATGKEVLPFDSAIRRSSDATRDVMRQVMKLK